eukprot:209803_1
MTGSGRTKYYRGIDSEFIFKRFLTKFYVPLSTTWDFTKATQFANPISSKGNGLVIELTRYNEWITGLDTTKMSVYPEEKEMLFFGGDSTFQIRTAYQSINRTWTCYKNYIDGLQILLDVANGRMEWERINHKTFVKNLKDIIGFILPNVYVNSPLPSYISLLLNYHLSMLPKSIIEYDIAELSKQHDWVKELFIKKPNIVHIANACNLFAKCKHFKIHMPSDNVMNDDDCKLLMEDISHITNKNLTLQFQWKAHIEMLKLIEICESFVQYAQLYKGIYLKTDIDSSPRSITLFACKNDDQTKAKTDTCASAKKRTKEYDWILIDFISGYVRIEAKMETLPKLLIKQILCLLHDYLGWKLADYNQISLILKNQNLKIEKRKLAIAFTKHLYHKQKLIDDLCDIFCNGAVQKILLAQIFAKELDIDYQYQSSNINMYDAILYNCVEKQELDNRNFVKILLGATCKLYPNFQAQKEIAKIANDLKITGNIMVKTSLEFKNSKQFANIFSSIHGFQRKVFAKVYMNINKWQVGKHNYGNYTGKSANTSIIQEFCAKTNVKENTARSFLVEAHWDISVALNNYHSAKQKFNKTV